LTCKQFDAIPNKGSLQISRCHWRICRPVSGRPAPEPGAV